MKKLYFFVLLLTVSLYSKAQAPQGINYQAVALSASGPLANHNISLQLSIIDSAVNGTVVYTETHATSTDALGLFSVVIGNGTPTLGTFGAINWGKNFKWLKTEIDTLGGSTFALMGISQLMSTPYALYANKSKPDFVDIEHPDGFSNVSAVLIGTANYTVPSGKNLYSPSGMTFNFIYNNFDTLFTGNFSEGQTIRILNDTMLCWLVDKTVDWITVDLLTNPITPPPGKSFVVVNTFPNPSGFYDSSTNSYSPPTIYLNGQIIKYFMPKIITTAFVQTNNVFIVPSGQTLSAVLGLYPGYYIINGYYKDN